MTSSDELISQLKVELERCLMSNKQKRSEVIEKSQEVKAVKTELSVLEGKCQDLEKTCQDQQVSEQHLTCQPHTNIDT